MRLRLIVTALGCAVVLLGAGCARNTATTAGDTGAGQEITTGIPLAPDFRIPDIPVPAGFDFDRTNSFVFQNGIIDVGSIQYTGKEHIADVLQFYNDEMPRYNWKLLSVAEHNTVTMSFEKPNKTCQVTLIPKTRGTVIQISFFPKSSPPQSQY